MSRPSLEVDNSQRSTFQACPQKYYLRYVQGMTTTYGSTAMRYGSTWHALMEGYYSSVKDHGYCERNISDAHSLAKKTWDHESKDLTFFEDYRTYNECITSFVHYLSEFQQDRMTMEILELERKFRIEIKLSQQEEKNFPSLAKNVLFFTGKLDKKVLLSGAKWLVEFKSTGQPIKMQVNRLNRSPQIIGYCWAEKQLDQEVSGCLISIHQILSRKSKVTGNYGKFTREFLRSPQLFSDGDLEAWKMSFLYTADLMCRARETNTYPRMYDSCYQFGKCQFTPLCEQNRPFCDLNLEGFIEKRWNVLES